MASIHTGQADAAPPADSRSKAQLLALLLVAPLLAHVLAVVLMVQRFEFDELDAIDYGVLIATLGAMVLLAVCVKQPRRMARFLAVLYSGIVAVAISEAALRSLYPAQPQNYPWPPMKLTSIAADTMVGVSGRIDFTVNSLGIRGPEVDLDDIALAILCLGGSATMCQYITDEESWPWRLGTQLSECVDRSVYVGNAARSGHIVIQNEYLLRHYPHAGRFDWIVVLAGLNDANTALAWYRREIARDLSPTLTSVAETFPWQRYYRNLAVFRMPTQLMNRRKSSEGLFPEDSNGAWYAGIRAARRVALRRQTLHEPPEELAEILELYRQDVTGLIHTAREMGLQMVFATQPTCYADDVSAELEETFMTFHSMDAAYSPGVYRKVLDAYNETLMEVCRLEGIPCVDLAARLPKDFSVFYDDVHFNTAGCAEVAEVFREFFYQELRQPAAAEAD